MKALLLLLLLAHGAPHANPSTDSVIAARAQAMQSMQAFHPQDVISNFTPTPRESSLQPNVGDNDELLQQAANVRLNQEDTARFVRSEEHRRAKITPNPQSIEITSAENLLASNNTYPAVVGCSDGSCDLTLAEVSDDINEGVSRLGAVAGTAEEVASNQVQTQQPAIFRGAMQECEKYMLGLRDCCTDDGLLEGIINCPRELQILQKAKREHRVVYLGHYKPHRFSTTRYRYCVFPTKLAGIVQIQGRYMQLGIGFGGVWHPDCRGVTPEELERINFKALDLNAMLAELIGQKHVPQDAAMDAANVAHVNAMHDQGRAHD